uniref:NADH-ubiquinone oxidoreductase 75 kDa subunit n=1 Tax=Paramoeba aparasomata TaxID=2583407 RepID=A0A5P8HBF5_9EUKA|nr:NADH dehydrogenase subunit 11 [Paramoeba aparasomata]
MEDSKTFNITINNKLFLTRTSNNIIQACNDNSINIPKFCYHKELSIAGNCRMCLVEVKGINKPIASCAIPVNKDMIIFTNSGLVKKAREGILEFILINHPLDCPICDQGGECDLQDQSLVFGSDKGRFYEYKRSVNDKDCGPFVKTVMTRCIHCTRCIRFLDEISGFKYLGLIGRGNKIEISNFINKSLYSELSGNIVDLCPVGALTIKTYSFKARPWELNSFNSIDLLDPFHVNIRVDVRDFQILRILPVYNNIINESWITDITRYSFDGFKNFRLLMPLKQENQKFLSLSWFETFNLLTNILNSNNINFILGNFLDMETLFILKKISLLKFETNNITFGVVDLKNNNLFNDYRRDYFTSSITLNNLLNYDNLILINSNIRLSNPLLNLKIKNFQKIKGSVFSIGSSFYQNFSIYNYDINLKHMLRLIVGRSELNFLLLSKKNLFIINNSVLETNFINNWNYIQNFLKKYLLIDFIVYDLNSTHINLVKEINVTNPLIKFNDISLNAIQKNKELTNCINYYLNTNLNMKNTVNYSIYQGSNYLTSKYLFNFMLPSVNYLEKNSIYVNFLGYYQKTKFILYPPKNSRSDWKIIYILFNFLIFKDFFNYNSFSKYRLNYNLFYSNTFIGNNLLVIKNYCINFFKINNNFKNGSHFNIYFSNQITISSKNIFRVFKKIKITNSNFY